MNMKIPGLTAFAMAAFAANSILCRLALGGETIDAASFSSVRLASGALTLLLITAVTGRAGAFRNRGDWGSAGVLFLYAVPFSFAYLDLGAGTGALLLFGAVQATMILAGLLAGERPHPLEWAGLGVALIGLIYLVFPGLTAPPLGGSLLMLTAGVAWGAYSLRGRGAADPIGATTGNFVRAVPLALAVSAAFITRSHLSTEGLALAFASGAVASGCGYVVWYAALRGLTATQAATVQLSVPVLAAAGGVAFLAEAVSVRLLLSSVAILGGVGLALSGRTHTSGPRAGSGQTG
jgi:drug/metabolite transporter (DMT)-like permease